MSPVDPRELIARRIARELRSGEVVNLGNGIARQVAEHLAPASGVILHCDSGLLGMRAAPGSGPTCLDLFGPDGRPVSLEPGGSCFDVAFSFGLVRGGHLDATVVGALEVDEEGSLASWAVPGGFTPGMGGAMDLVIGARRVIVAMQHTTRDGRPRFLRRCTLPLTARGEVDLLVTELAVFRFEPAGPVLVELQPGATLDVVRARTEARFAHRRDAACVA